MRTTHEGAVDLSGSETPAGDPVRLLTPREREVLALVVRGLTSRAIAEELVVSKRTVDTHIEHIREKLKVRTKVQIAAWGGRAGLSLR